MSDEWSWPPPDEENDMEVAEILHRRLEDCRMHIAEQAELRNALAKKAEHQSELWGAFATAWFFIGIAAFLWWNAPVASIMLVFGVINLVLAIKGTPTAREWGIGDDV